MSTKLHPLYYLPYWEQAHAHEIGLLIEVVAEDRQLLTAALYDCKSLIGRPEYDDMMIFQPTETTIYIAHKAVELPP